MGTEFRREETGLTADKVITEQDLQGWPNHWPPPCKFLGPLIFNITAFTFVSASSEHQVILRFKNRYGARISENFFHRGLYLVDILRFSDLGDEAYGPVYDATIPDPAWYYNSHEVFALCEKVAQWERPADVSN